MKSLILSLFWMAMLAMPLSFAMAEDSWVTYEGGDGPGKGKSIVLISGDEEYRSEEALPMFGQMLSKRFGFKCTVLFSLNPETGEIDPNNQQNIPRHRKRFVGRPGHHHDPLS